jgi:hypothetical protein
MMKPRLHFGKSSPPFIFPNLALEMANSSFLIKYEFSQSYVINLLQDLLWSKDHIHTASHIPYAVPPYIGQLE